MAKSLNRVQLIGNLTRDPELRYTPNGTAVCSFSIATNRNWSTDTGEKKEEVEYHRIVAWNKLAEICSQFLTKGRKAFVEGRLSTRSWTAQDGTQKQTTEIIITDMILLDSKRSGEDTVQSDIGEVPQDNSYEEKNEKKSPVKLNKKTEKTKDTPNDDEIVPDDIPF